MLHFHAVAGDPSRSSLMSSPHGATTTAWPCPPNAAVVLSKDRHARWPLPSVVVSTTVASPDDDHDDGAGVAFQLCCGELGLQ